MAEQLNKTIVGPEWLNADFIESYLKNYFKNEQIKVSGLEIRPAAAPGENFVSNMYRVQVNYSKQTDDNSSSTLSVIVKSALTGEAAVGPLKAFNVYKKEIEFYGKIAPKIKELLTKLNESDQLIADSYGVCSTNDVMIFEDLKVKSYRTSSIHRGFNFDEAKIVLKKAATFHAINAVLQQQQPNIFELFNFGLMSQHTNVYDTFYSTQFDAMIAAISSWPNANHYTEKFGRLRSSLVERGSKAFDANANHFNTLNHGDMWANNIMIKCSEEPASAKTDQRDLKIENMIFIDFQYSCFTSPAIDLHYFFNTSLQESLRPSRFDELIAFYHGQLVTYLTRLEYPKAIPNLEEFKQQYLEKSFYGFVTACLLQPIVLNESTENADYEAVIMDDDRALQYKRKMFESDKIQANLRKLLPIYDEMGLFD